MQTEFYKLFWGHGFGWQKQEISSKEFQTSQKGSPSGVCVCPKCGYSTPHKVGIPRSILQYPKCKINLERH